MGAPVVSPPTVAPPVAVADAAPPLPVVPRADLATLEPFIVETMAAWKVPGLSIAVVQDGKVVFSKAYGVRDAERKLPVTTKTLFGIGSVTKMMTADALATLVDEGKLDWDTPVVRYLPSFALHDETTTARATLRDLASHRVGVPDHWFLWFGADPPLKRDELLARLRFLEPNHQLRETFEYNTLMFVALGETGARVAGAKSAEAFIAERIWKPLGMTQSNFSVHATQKSADFAMPYRRVEGKIERAELRDQDAVGPGGAVNSTAEDMARFVAMEAGGGSFAGRAIVGAATMRELHRTQIVPPEGSIHPELSPWAYGLGHHVRTYRGHRMAGHGGGIDGVAAQVNVLPDDRIGVVVLSNLTYGDNMAPTVIANTVLDRLISASPIDWQKIFYDRAVEGWKSADAAAAAPTKRHEGTTPSHALADFAGDFENPAYGAARVEAAGGVLKLVFHGTHPLEHVHYDVFGVAHDRRDDFDRMRLVFATSADGDIVSFAMPLEPATKPIVFLRGPNRAMANEKFLAPFVGDYVLGKSTMRIAMRGKDAIVAVMPGGQTWRLVPTRGTTFAVDGHAGTTIEFSGGAAILHNPDGDVTAKKK